MNGLPSYSLGVNNNNDGITPGAIFAPGGTNLLPLSETPLVGNFEDQSGLIFIGMRNFGKEVIESFISLTMQYNDGFDWRKIKLILIDADPILDQETTRFSLNQGTFSTNFSNLLETNFSTWNNNQTIKIILIARLLDSNICSDVYKVITNIPKKYTDRSAFISFSDTSNIGDTQKAGLREFLHWQQRGWHEPDAHDNEYLKDIYLFNQEDRNLVQKMGLSLFTRLYRKIRNATQLIDNQENSPIFTCDVRGCGIPVALILDYYACRLSEQLIFGFRGLFSDSNLDQSLVDRIISDRSYNQILDRLTPLQSPGDYGYEMMSYLNDRTCEERWQRLYTALLFEQKKSSKPFIQNNLGLFDHFLITNGQPGSFIEAIKTELQKNQKTVIDQLVKKVSDPYLKWNIDKEKIVFETEKCVDMLNSNINTERIQKELGPHLQLHLGLTDGYYSIFPVCIPARWEGGLNSGDHKFTFPNQIGEFVSSVWRLAREWIKYQFTNLPRLSANGLRESDKSFLYEKEDVFLSESNDHQFESRMLIIHQDQKEILTENFFLPGTQPSKITWNESNLVLTYKQMAKNKSRLIEFLLERQSGDTKYSDDHLVVAEKYESQYRQTHFDCSNGWCFCDDVILTFNNGDAVSLFWKAVDRGNLVWIAAQQSWSFKKIGDYTNKVMLDTPEFHSKSLDSLAEAYWQFTVELPRELNDTNGAYHLPMHKKNRGNFFQALKNVNSTSEVKNEVRDWLKNEYVKIKDKRSSDARLRYLQDCYRLYTVARTG